MSFEIQTIESMIEKHMSEQPYDAVCSACGLKLACTCEVDGDYDIKVTVDPCENCIKENEE